jgi:ribose 5-phosphate isomerase B
LLDTHPERNDNQTCQTVRDFGAKEIQVSEIDDQQIHQIVQRVLGQVLGRSQLGGAPVSASPFPVVAPASSPQLKTGGGKIVALGADHGGYELREILRKYLTELGFDVKDLGAYNKDPVDYPDFAHEVAKQVSTGKAWRGIMIDGAGIGSCIVANKVPGVRAGMAYDLSSAMNSREHNDANVLTLGAGLIGVNLAKQIVKIWLETEFGGGRHAQRVNKIAEVEKQYLK